MPSELHNDAHLHCSDRPCEDLYCRDVGRGWDSLVGGIRWPPQGLKTRNSGPSLSEHRIWFSTSGHLFSFQASLTKQVYMFPNKLLHIFLNVLSLGTVAAGCLHYLTLFLKRNVSQSELDIIWWVESHSGIQIFQSLLFSSDSRKSHKSLWKMTVFSLCENSFHAWILQRAWLP